MTWTELLTFLQNTTDAEEVNERREEIAEWLPCVREMFEYDQNNNYHQFL